MLSRYTGKTVCPDCGGGRLRKEAFYVQVGGKHIGELVTMPVDELQRFSTVCGSTTATGKPLRGC